MELRGDFCVSFWYQCGDDHGEDKVLVMHLGQKMFYGSDGKKEERGGQLRRGKVWPWFYRLLAVSRRKTLGFIPVYL